jgi:lipopolysaccharide export system protein LptC
MSRRMATTDTFPGHLGHGVATSGSMGSSHVGSGHVGNVDAGPRRRHNPIQISAADRNRVFRQAKRHSFLVRLLRFVCPVAAVLSFGWYFTNKRIELDVGGGKFSGEIPTIQGDNLKMENPRYEGFTAEGGKFNVTAKTGYQDFRNPARVRLITIDSHLTQANEQWAHLISDEGLYDTKGDLLDLSGNIKVTSSNGMTAYLKTAQVGTKTQIVTSKDPVLVEMANGTTVDADGMVLNAKTKEVTFEGKVRTHLVRDQATKKDPVTGQPAPKGAQP